MKKPTFEIIESDGKPIKAWTRGVPVDESAKQQLRNIAGMPFIYSHVAVMPDVHWGCGATVGSVIATKGAIIPAAVGVDIGCGMAAQRTTLTAADLPDNLHALRAAIEARIHMAAQTMELRATKERGRKLCQKYRLGFLRHWRKLQPNIQSWSMRHTAHRTTLARLALAITSLRSA